MPLTREDLEALQSMRDRLEHGEGVLTAGTIHDDIPTIHDVGHRDGAKIKVPFAVVHCGFGLFKAPAPTDEARDGAFFFDGGGMMRRSPGFSWTPFSARGHDVSEVYDVAKASAAVDELIESLSVEQA